MNGKGKGGDVRSAPSHRRKKPPTPKFSAPSHTRLGGGPARARGGTQQRSSFFEGLANCFFWLLECWGRGEGWHAWAEDMGPIIHTTRAAASSRTQPPARRRGAVWVSGVREGVEEWVGGWCNGVRVGDYPAPPQILKLIYKIEF